MGRVEGGVIACSLLFIQAYSFKKIIFVIISSVFVANVETSIIILNENKNKIDQRVRN